MNIVPTDQEIEDQYRVKLGGNAGLNTKWGKLAMADLVHIHDEKPGQSSMYYAVRLHDYSQGKYKYSAEKVAEGLEKCREKDLLNKPHDASSFTLEEFQEAQSMGTILSRATRRTRPKDLKEIRKDALTQNMINQGILVRPGPVRTYSPLVLGHVTMSDRSSTVVDSTVPTNPPPACPPLSVSQSAPEVRPTVSTSWIQPLPVAFEVSPSQDRPRRAGDNSQSPPSKKMTSSAVAGAGTTDFEVGAGGVQQGIWRDLLWVIEGSKVFIRVNQLPHHIVRCKVEADKLDFELKYTWLPATELVDESTNQAVRVIAPSVKTALNSHLGGFYWTITGRLPCTPVTTGDLKLKKVEDPDLNASWYIITLTAVFKPNQSSSYLSYIDDINTNEV